MGTLDDAVQEYLQKPHDVVIYPDVMEDGTVVYMSTDPGLPGCVSDGRTPAEAEANLEDARAVYVRGLLVRGLQLPERVTTSAGTSMSYRSLSVILSCCDQDTETVPEMQRFSFDVPVVEAVSRV